ncbi:MAG: hypothetical protein HOV81_42790 [Kofleriaceae bacterium]|nr:hypothetical protein [Kofleriaceae bacterium]
MAGAFGTACGRVGFDAASQDAAVPSGPFEAPQEITELSSAGDDDDPTLTADMLEIYFASTRTSGMGGISDLFSSTRASVDEPWSPPVFVTELNTATNEESPGISPDGLTLWFSRATGANPDLYVTTRTARGQPWNPPVLVTELNTTDLELSPEPARDGLRIAFYRETPRVLYEATRATPTSLWNSAVRISELSDPVYGHKSPFFVSDRELWLAWNPSGTYDLYRAIRPAPDQPFGLPMLVEGTDLNIAGADDDDPWLSPDGATLVMSSSRPELGKQKIYIAHRSP